MPRGRNRRRWWLILAITVAIALRSAFWGEPVETHYRVLPESAPSGGAARASWIIQRANGSRETWHARDTGGDGVMDEFDTPAGKFARPGLRAEPKRWLVICLDGVPLRVLQDLWDCGHFREFFRPTAAVSVFPSDSEAALTTVLHAAPPPGYEHRYFDRGGGALRGGWWVTISGRGIPYIAALGYDPPGWAKALAYVMPTKTYRADLGRLRKRFLASRERVFLAHVSSSDSLFHLWPARQVEPFLAEFEAVVRDLYLDARGELGVLVFSDHGNTQTPSHAAPVAQFLAQRGWRLATSLAKPRDVVAPAYGLVGFAAIYCAPEATEALARDLAPLEGADLIVYPDPERAPLLAQSAAGAQGETHNAQPWPLAYNNAEPQAGAARAAGSVVILRASGRARLVWNAEGSRFWYEATAADPLERAPVFAKLRAENRLAADGSASDADLFAATWDTHYPDAAGRLRDWATNHVQNRANILISFQPGYYHGAGIFERMVSLAGTHGALEAASSLGFAMSTHPLPPALRLSNLLPRELLKKRGTVAVLQE